MLTAKVSVPLNGVLLLNQHLDGDEYERIFGFRPLKRGSSSKRAHGKSTNDSIPRFRPLKRGSSSKHHGLYDIWKQINYVSVPLNGVLLLNPLPATAHAPRGVCACFAAHTALCRKAGVWADDLRPRIAQSPCVSDIGAQTLPSPDFCIIYAVFRINVGVMRACARPRRRSAFGAAG